MRDARRRNEEKMREVAKHDKSTTRVTDEELERRAKEPDIGVPRGRNATLKCYRCGKQKTEGRADATRMRAMFGDLQREHHESRDRLL